MKNTNQLGLWMDDTVAYLVQFTTKPFTIQTIVREFHTEDKKSNLIKKILLLSSYKETGLNKHYNKIGKELLKYEKIILFGPSEAKLYFFDFLNKDERFLNLKIEVKDADKMSVNEQHEFIKEYFGKLDILKL
ncbi:hypothetical protein [Flavobacterium sp. Arc2]|jgi:stalled ribosome rescue protein Dom34|uniref:hypothetical protein n=1 Tax=Flavobacterium sp. Arc2 TaxID=3046685 RepID=UPI00352CFB97